MKYFESPVLNKVYPVKKERKESGSTVEVYEFNEGYYGFRSGFPEINAQERRWFHGGNDNVEFRQSHSFELDTHNPLYQEVLAELKSGLTQVSVTDPEAILKALSSVINNRIASIPLDDFEHSGKMSDIIKNKKGACASKTLVAGLLIKDCFPGASAAHIQGQLGPIKEKAGYPFSHAWLRFQIGNHIFLYDSMYDKYQILAMDSNQVFEHSGNYDFSRNGVGAYGLSGVAKKLGANALGSGHIVPVQDYDSHVKSVDPYVRQDLSLSAQVFGVYTDLYVPKHAELTIIDDCFVVPVSHTSNNENGPVVKYPITEIIAR